MIHKDKISALEEHFSSELQKALRARYGKVPSAAFVAKQFNRHITQPVSVSHESIRRWIRGLSMPSYSNLQDIAVWLQIDLDSLLGIAREKQVPSYSEDILNAAKIISDLPSDAQSNLLKFVTSMGSSATYNAQKF